MHRKYLRFTWRGKSYEFTCLPFGLSYGPRIFTKLLKSVVNYLRSRGNVSVFYWDGLLLLANTNKMQEFSPGNKIVSRRTGRVGWTSNTSTFARFYIRPLDNCNVKRKWPRDFFTLRALLEEGLDKNIRPPYS